ncbi:MAG: amino acid permease [Hyphomonadaceae bacterium]|nr:amino acid permease [Hyphomonadaceae bacterium]
MSENGSQAKTVRKPLGFWGCWSLTVGVMIGSGVFTLPAVLAPYGTLSFGGWLISGLGSILLALTIGRLASRTSRSGGPYVYTRDAFGDFFAFLIAWGHWLSYWIAIPAIALAFVGYLPVFIPALADRTLWQALAALTLIWTLTLVCVAGVREAGFAQLAMTVLKLIPLLAVIALGVIAGERQNLPAFSPSGEPVFAVLATTALLTMWAFSGLEAGSLPASDVTDAQRTIPRAVVSGTILVTVVYIAATAAVMLLVPAAELAQSTAPFSDAARAFGAWGPLLVAAGALAATAGALNGVIFVAGQLPMAAAIDRLAPRFLSRTNAGGSPYAALLISSVLGSLLLAMNYSRGLIGAFTFLSMMSTLAVLVPLLASAAAELRHSWKSAKGWAAVALLAGVICLFAIVGSGAEVIGWGMALLLLGAPLYYVLRQPQKVPA